MDNRSLCEEIFISGVRSVMPGNLVNRHLKVTDNILVAGGREFDLDTVKNIYVIGAGKASAYMASAVEKILNDRITGGCVVVKYGFGTGLKAIKVIEAGHPVPDSNSYTATEEIIGIAKQAGEKDLVISLFSGGGSSLLADVPEGCAHDDIMKLNDLLVNSGATIEEINTVRKHLSLVKGGQLAGIVSPASLINLMISDVPGNMPDVIASGPAVPDPTTFSQALEVIAKYEINAIVPAGILTYLEEGVSGLKKETPKPGDVAFKNTISILAGSNKIALESAQSTAIAYGLSTQIITDSLQGDVNAVARHIVDFAGNVQFDESVSKPACFLFGGETTIKMTGKGMGGRNQHLALLIAEMLSGKNGITVLCAGTDGNDGPTEAAGAIVDSDTVVKARTMLVEPQEYLKRFDSFNFFRKVGGHVITGPTKTNVMDIIVVLADHTGSKDR